MASHWNFKNFADASNGGNIDPRPPASFPLARQSSVYSLTFDEFQNTLTGVGKDFGSMNMDELLKNIWTAEETQVIMNNSSTGGVEVNSGNLQRQGSLTLPRTLSQKTVDEVWKDLLKDNSGSGSGGGSTMPQRQQTLGEMTLEEFLVRAGVVREDTQLNAQPNDTGLYNNNSSNNAGFAVAFSQPAQATMLTNNNNISIANPLPNLGIKPSEPQPQILFPKQANFAFGPSMALVNNAQLAGQGINKTLIAQSEGPGMAGLRTGVTVAAVSPGTSSADASSLSPVPYAFSRGRRSNGGLEKVVERRQRRMIKNRESAARSRARKQAYTLELEAEVAKLKEMNEELQKKQAEIMEMQKNKLTEPIKRPWGAKRRCLRRTLTGPW